MGIEILEVLLKRSRLVVLATIIVIAALAWIYTIYLAQGMDNMAMPQAQAWGAGEFSLMFMMWTVMMVAMMLPSAAPLILLFDSVYHSRRARGDEFVSTGVFLSGYIAIWIAFAAVATVVQWGLHAATLMSPMMVSTSNVLSGILLVTAGLYQWSYLKYVCITHCRSPLGFLMTDWREGNSGALLMGIRHGGFCLGCCWVLMSLLFVLGVMNLVWIAALAVFVLVEKMLPQSLWMSRASGLVLVAAGIWKILGT